MAGAVNLPALRGKVEISFSDLEAAALKAKLLGDVLKKELGSSETTTAIKNVGKAAEGLGASVPAAFPSLSDLGSAFGAVGAAGGKVIPVLIGLGIAAAVVLSPAIASLTGQLASLAVGLGVFGGLGVLGALVTGLAVKTNDWASASANLTKAQQGLAAAQDAVNNAVKPTRVQLDALKDAQDQLAVALKATDNPWTRLTDHLGKVADALGNQVTPAATQILTFLNGLIDPIAAVGSSLASWFGGVLPQVLVVAQDLFDALGEAGQRLVTGLAPVFAKLIADPVAFEQNFSKTANEVADAVVGLVKILASLAEWWEGPQGQKMASQAGAVMDAIGTATQGVIFLVEALVVGMSHLGDAMSHMGLLTSLAISGFVADFGRAERAVASLASAIMNMPVVGGALSAIGVPRAAGGPVVPNSVYRVGERGPETLVMGSSGGYVIPNAGTDGGAGVNMRTSERLLDDMRSLLQVLVARTEPLQVQPSRRP